MRVARRAGNRQAKSATIVMTIKGRAERDGIVWTYLIKPVGEETRQRERSDRAQKQTARGQSKSPRQDQSQQIGDACAERHS